MEAPLPDAVEPQGADASTPAGRLGAGSLGNAGAGGQLGFGDRELEVGFGWLSNQMGGYGDARTRTLTEALDRVLRG